eukprot:COSAG06_NODE_1496_length_9275_cov_20.266783_8_plen_86_part_00
MFCFVHLVCRWALGCLLYEMLDGWPPFHAGAACRFPDASDIESTTTFYQDRLGTDKRTAGRKTETKAWLASASIMQRTRLRSGLE